MGKPHVYRKLDENPVTLTFFPEIHDTVKSRCNVTRSLLLLVSLTIGLVILVVFMWPNCLDSEAKGQDHVTVPGYEPHIRSVNDPDQPWLNIRLPGDLQPIHYDISIYPEFYEQDGRFSGSEIIQIKVVKQTRVVLLHSNGLTISEVKVEDKVTGSQLTINDTFFYEPFNYYVIRMVDAIDQGKELLLSLSFEGSMLDRMDGLYKSSYTDSISGEIRYLATTHFEPVSARKAFPCFDEPSYKAQFTISLTHRKDYIGLSNMPQDGESVPLEGSADLVKSTFQRSVTMSSYLVCFVICQYKYLETKSTSGKLIRVYAPEDRLSQGQYSLTVAKRTIDDFESRLNLEYALPKVDLISIPDFTAGAMENWGLITFRETALLCDLDIVSAVGQQRVAQIVVHELAHQWFGNLVTMSWWNDLWLNEGFASYMEFPGTKASEPDWDMLQQIVPMDLQEAMRDDALPASHPIVNDVTYPDEISAMFDVISYEKGASVLRMLVSYLGEEKFYRGIQLYLQTKKWENAVTLDLWEALNQIQPGVKHMMDTWTRQEGFPVVALKSRDNPDGTCSVWAEQTRFLSSSKPDNSDSTLRFSNSDYKWFIPLTYKTSTGKSGTHNMDLTDIAFTEDFGLVDPNVWVKFNSDTNGYYRVKYSENLWNRLSDYLLTTTDPKSWTLSEADRSGLLSDAFSLAEAGQVTYDQPLRLAQYLSHEMSFVPWASAITDGFSYVTTMLRENPDYNLWESYVIRRVSPVLSQLGWGAGGSHLDRQLRGLLASEACAHNDEGSLMEVAKQFREWIDGGQSPPADIEKPVFQYGMAYDGTEADWDKVWGLYLQAKTPQEKENFLKSLASTRLPHLIEKLLENARLEKDIKRQDFFTVISYVSGNDVARPILWDWVRLHYQFLTDKFTVNDRNFGRMVPGIVSVFNTREQLSEVMDLFDKFPNAGAGRIPRQSALASIERNIQWMESYAPSLLQWLREHLETS